MNSIVTVFANVLHDILYMYMEVWSMSLQRDDEEKRRHTTLLVGGVHYDIVYKLLQNIIESDLNDVLHVERRFGGSAFTMGYILKHLNNKSLVIITTKGNDPATDLIKRYLDQLGIAMEGIPISMPTAHSAEFHGANGDLPTSVIEKAIYKELSIKQFSLALQKFKTADTIITDTSFEDEIYHCLANFIAQNKQKLYVKISSSSSAINIISLLSNCESLVGTVQQLNTLTQNYDVSDKGIWRTLDILAKKGTKSVFAIHGNKGVYAIVHGKQIHIPALIVDKALSTQGIAHGTTDVFAATVFNGMLKGKTPEQAIKEGLIAVELRKQNKDVNEAAIEAYFQIQAQEAKITKNLLPQPQPIPL